VRATKWLGEELAPALAGPQGNRTKAVGMRCPNNGTKADRHQVLYSR